ncbi:MAG: proliferating cell nuclear antigen (pcna) [Promethearchaeota archaeon]
MSFSLRLENSRVLKGIVETLSNIIDETKVKITPKEFTITAIDPSRICLLKLLIKKEDFDDYSCSKNFEIGINLGDLDKILKRSSANDAITIEYKEEEQKLKIKMKRPDTSRTRTFSLALKDLEIEEIPFETLFGIEYNAVWEIEPEFLEEAIKDADIYSEVLNIKAIKDEGLIFSASGEIGEMEYNLTLDDLPTSEIEETCSGAYSINFLKAILKITQITIKLQMSLKTDHPLKIIFEIENGGELSFFLAPRVEEPEFEDEDEDFDEF